MTIKKYTYFDEEKEPMIIGVDQELMMGVDRARHTAGIPFVPMSGKRTAERNLEVGGVVDSAHVSGHALDLRCRNSQECALIVSSLLKEGLNRIVIGIRLERNPIDGKVVVVYHNIHVDNDSTKPSPVLAIKLYGDSLVA